MHYTKPSKQFIKRASAITILVLILLGTQTSWFKNKINRKEPNIVAGDQTIKGVLEKDSNNNGISDWEESLWGLNPTINGISNKETIEMKKKALGTQQTESPSDLDDTDKLARELFILASTLGQSDEVDDETLQSIVNKLSDSIKTDGRVLYSLKDIKTVSTSSESIHNYYLEIAVIMKFFDTGSGDIDVVVKALESGDSTNLPELNKTRDAYRDYARKLVSIPVPVGLADYHLNLVNGFVGIAEAFSYLAKIENDGINGLVGVAIYKAYNTRASIALIHIKEYLIKYGII